jgi:hypothetical protein
MKYPCVFDWADHCNKGDGITENNGRCILNPARCSGYKPLRVNSNQHLIRKLSKKRKEYAEQIEILMADNLRILREIAEIQK